MLAQTSSPSKLTRMALHSTAPDAAARARGSRTGAANASRRSGESYSGARFATMRLPQTLTRLRIHITRFIASCIGDGARRGARNPPRLAKGQGRIACQRDTPIKTGRPGPEGLPSRERGRAIVDPNRARSNPHALLRCTWVDTTSECGRNAEFGGLIQGGENAACPRLDAILASS